MNLNERDLVVRELMDDPECDPERLRATLRRFDTVNRLVAGWGHVYRSQIRPYLYAREGSGRRLRVLDLGCGGGDVIARLAYSAAADGLQADWLGVDPDARAIEVASARDSPTNLSFVCTDSAALLESGERFDLVLSNHVLHHLPTDQLTTFAAESRWLSHGAVMHGDIERGHTAYALYAAGITPLAPGTFLRTDGLRSIRRSYRAAELVTALGSPWRIHRPARFRVMAVAAGAASD
ncbi:methyltransferase domain-containing protein (plasmid) [Coraliomargarita sp. W4R53]